MTDNEEYAKLLSSIKIANTNLKRILSPIQTARQIQRLINEEGIKNVEDLLPLNKGNITYFIRLLDLPEKCHDAIVWGESNDLGVGFSAATIISTLKDKDDQLLLFNETSKRSISEKDVRQIISFYKKHDLPLSTIIQNVTNARPQILNTYLVVISISPKTETKLKNNAHLMGKRPLELLKECFQNKFLICIDDIQLKGKNVGIKMSEMEYKKYKKNISLLGLEYDGIIDHVME